MSIQAMLLLQKGGVVHGRKILDQVFKKTNILRSSVSGRNRYLHTSTVMCREHQYEFDEMELSKLERRWSEPKGVDTGVVVHNTLTKRRERLILPDGFVKWYTCGPTVYDHTHIGHASSYVNLDIIRRILVSIFGIDVVMVMGVTDIDDKIIKRAQDSDIEIGKISKKYEKEFFRDMARLNVRPPTVKMRVTENIPEIVEFISKILARGHAYVTPAGNVYFKVSKIANYPKLLFNVEDSEDSSSQTDKLNPRDFVLWKTQKPGEPWFESPWSRGRPGWHIECSAMSSRIFGESLDIHSGGIDLAFPHHSNEIAQCESCHQVKQWTNYFIHTGHLHLKDDSEKMSKSLNNFLTVGEMLERYSSNHFRLFCLLSRYRTGVEYGDESMLRAVGVYKTISTFINNTQAYVGGADTSRGQVNETHLLQRFKETKDSVMTNLADDFTTSKAVSAIETLVHDCNSEIFSENNKQLGSHLVGSRSPSVVALLSQYVEDIMVKLGVTFSDKSSGVIGGGFEDVTQVIDSVVKFRSDVRDFALSKSQSDKPTSAGHKRDRRVLLEYCDALRDSMNETGIEIKDQKGKPSWNFTEKAGKMTTED